MRSRELADAQKLLKYLLPQGERFCKVVNLASLDVEI